MSCDERLSHAIHIDKIKIYPNSTMIIEKTVKRNIIETHDERVGQKAKNNEYHNDYYNKEHLAHFDDPELHDDMANREDQTWYFVLADCFGTLEIYQDEVTKRDHLLGLDVFW